MVLIDFLCDQFSRTYETSSLLLSHEFDVHHRPTKLASDSRPFSWSPPLTCSSSTFPSLLFAGKTRIPHSIYSNAAIPCVSSIHYYGCPVLAAAAAAREESAPPHLWRRSRRRRYCRVALLVGRAFLGHESTKAFWQVQGTQATAATTTISGRS